MRFVEPLIDEMHKKIDEINLKNRLKTGETEKKWANIALFSQKICTLL